VKKAEKFDVAVVGAGITGLAAACLASRNGLRTCVIDSAVDPEHHNGWKPELPNPRVSALNNASVNLMDHLGVWQTMLERDACAYQTMTVRDSASPAKISFDVSDSGTIVADFSASPSLGYIVENGLVIAVMLDRLRQNYNVALLFEHTVDSLVQTADALELGFAGEHRGISAELVIAADGAHSALRTLSGINCQSDSFDQIALVAEVSCELPHQHTAWQCFTPDGPIALLPRRNNICSLVWSADHSLAIQLQALSPEDFSGHLNLAFEDQPGTLSITDQVKGFPLYNRHAASYIAPHLALIGDAAHTVHPLAGLGANIGLLDAASLMQVVQSAHSSGKSIGGHSVLRRYERWRKGENRAVLELMNLFKQGFGTRDPLLTRLRQSAFSVADSLPALKSGIIAYATGLVGDLPDACRPAQAARVHGPG